MDMSHFHTLYCLNRIGVERILERSFQEISTQYQKVTIMETFVVNLLNTVRRNMKVSSATAPNCPAEELVLAYAYHELSTEDEKIVGDHVHECLDCLDMVLAARHAEEVSDDMADIPLPAWLTTPFADAASDLSERQAEKMINWRYPSVQDMMNHVRKRWGQMLEWPLAAMESFSFENTLLAAAFRPEFLSMQAADYDGRIITAKWVQVENGDIIDIKPMNVRMRHQKIVGNRLEISGELPSELKQVKKVAFLFGWLISDGTLVSLAFETGEIRGGYFFKNLTSEYLLDPTGKLKMLVIGY